MVRSCWLLLVCAVASLAAPPQNDNAIRPFLAQHCLKCHNASAGRLNLEASIDRVKWELVLLLLVLLLSMTPTAGMFRWSFRWLPFFHLVLAICAAEALRLKPRSPTPASTALGLVVSIGVIALIFHATGRYALPLNCIFIGLAVVWLGFEFRRICPSLAGHYKNPAIERRLTSPIR